MMVNGEKIYLTNPEGKGRFLGKYCGTCGTPTAWAQSRKTGKYYLCETQAIEVTEDAVVLYALPQHVHSEYCGTRTDVFQAIEDIDLGDYQLVDADGNPLDAEPEEAEVEKPKPKRTRKPPAKKTTAAAKAKADEAVDAAEKKTQARTGTRKRRTTTKKTSE